MCHRIIVFIVKFPIRKINFLGVEGYQKRFFMIHQIYFLQRGNREKFISRWPHTIVFQNGQL